MSDTLLLNPGRSIQGASGDWYRILQLLGAGGNAVTYLVVATGGARTGVPFALKFFRKLSRPERLVAFQDEVAFLKDCDHPAIMRVYDDGTFTFRVGHEEITYPFLVAEYLPYTLHQVIRGGTASITDRTVFASQLVSALAYLEVQNPPVVHRDVKPQNIFIKGHACVLGDFGLLKRLDGEYDEDREIFKESVGVGMPYFYRSPDLVDYANQVAMLTTKSDVFQLGLVLTELFTSRNPCVRPANGDPLGPVVLEDIRDIPTGNAGLIAPLLYRMLELNPDDRPAASEIVGNWLGTFELLAEKARDLNGTVF